MTKPSRPKDPEIERIAKEEWPRVKRFFRSKIAEPDCYDLATMTILAWLEKVGPDVENPKRYLWGVARFQLLKYFEKKRPSQQFDSSIHAVGARYTSIGTQLNRRMRVLDALRSIPLELQMAFELRYGEELSLEETAQALEISLVTVKRRLTQAAELLRKALGEGGDEAGMVREVADAYRED